MTAKGYCTVQNVADLLALEMTAAQAVQAQRLIERAEVYIDEETNRAWLTGAQTDEAHYNPTYKVWLKYAPVTSVSAVTGRSGPGETEETLVLNEDYEVRDLVGGLIYLDNPGLYDRILVDYTPVTTVPGDIQQAACELVATWLMPHLQTGSFGLDSFSLPDLTVKFARSHVQEAVPPGVERVLGRYRFKVTG